MSIKKKDILKHLCHYGIPEMKISHLRSSVNDVYVIGNNDYILRMHQMRDNIDTLYNISNQPRRSHILEAAGAQIVPAASPYVFLDDNYISTIWEYGEQSNNKSDIFNALNSLHSIYDKSVIEALRLPRMDIISIIQKRVDEFTIKTDHKDIADFLLREVEQARIENEHIANAGNNIVHLDGYQRNIVLYNEKPSLIDLDTLSLGPYQYDYIVSYVSSILSHQEIDKNIIETVTKWDLFEEAYHLRLIEMLSWIAVMSLSSDIHEKELILGYESIVNGRDYKWDLTL